MFINTGLKKKKKWEKKLWIFVAPAILCIIAHLAQKLGAVTWCSCPVAILLTIPQSFRWMKQQNGGFYWRVDSLSLIIWLSLWNLISGMCLILFFEAFTTSLSTQSLLINPYHFQVKQTFLFHETKKGHVSSPRNMSPEKKVVGRLLPFEMAPF